MSASGLVPAAGGAIAAVDAREHERGRLRRELHDGVGAALMGIILTIGAEHPGTAPGARQLLARVERDLVEVTQELRVLIDDLRPPALEDLGLAGALRRHAARLGRGSALRMTVTSDEAVEASPLPACVQLAAYRIASEGMTNAARHARATRCDVRLTRERDVLRLVICDDGAGLPARRRDGVGLGAMRERAAELAGLCHIESAPAGGTVVDCRLPLRP
jgi:signal transduction histidine kinase